MGAVVPTYLEHDLELFDLTGVEDKPQDDAKGALELLRNAGIRIWMLTGDKVETARCIAISKLVARGQYIYEMSRRMFALPHHDFCFVFGAHELIVRTADQIRDQLDFLQNNTTTALSSTKSPSRCVAF